MIGRINISGGITTEEKKKLLLLSGVPPVFQLLMQTNKSYPLNVWKNHTMIYEGMNYQFVHTFSVNNDFCFLLLDSLSSGFIKSYLFMVQSFQNDFVWWAGVGEAENSHEGISHVSDSLTRSHDGHVLLVVL